MKDLNQMGYNAGCFIRRALIKIKEHKIVSISAAALFLGLIALIVFVVQSKTDTKVQELNYQINSSEITITDMDLHDENIEQINDIVKKYNEEKEKSINDIKIVEDSEDYKNNISISKVYEVNFVNCKFDNIKKAKLSSAFSSVSYSSCKMKYSEALKILGKSKIKILDMSSNEIEEEAKPVFFKKITAEMVTVVNQHMSKLELLRYIDDSVIELCAQNCEITSIDILRKFKNLYLLDLKNNEIKSIEPLKDIETLSSLTLMNNDITDFSPLEKSSSIISYIDIDNNENSDANTFPQSFPNVDCFYASNSGITNVNMLEDSLKLRDLHIDNTSIYSIMPLKNISKLEILYSYCTRITDYSPLEKSKNSLQTLSIYKVDLSFDDINGSYLIPDSMPNLEELDVNGCGLKNLDFLKNSTKLKSLMAYSNSIKDISTLKNCRFLEKINFSYNDIEDLSPLEASKSSISSLNISGNPIKEETIPTQMVNLEIFFADNSKLSNINFLRKSILLKRLNAFKNSIESLEPLRNLHKLEDIVINDNKIENLDPLKGSSNMLKYLDVSNNKIKNLQVLKGSNIEVLIADKCGISSLKDLSDSKNIRILSACGNNIETTQGIEGLTTLEFLALSNNKINEIGVDKPLSFSKNQDVVLALDNNKLTSIKSLEKQYSFYILLVGKNEIKENIDYSYSEINDSDLISYESRTNALNECLKKISIINKFKSE